MKKYLFTLLFFAIATGFAQTPKVESGGLFAKRKEAAFLNKVKRARKKQPDDNKPHNSLVGLRTTVAGGLFSGPKTAGYKAFRYRDFRFVSLYQVKRWSAGFELYTASAEFSKPIGESAPIDFSYQGSNLSFRLAVGFDILQKPFLNVRAMLFVALYNSYNEAAFGGGKGSFGYRFPDNAFASEELRAFYEKRASDELIFINPLELSLDIVYPIKIKRSVLEVGISPYLSPFNTNFLLGRFGLPVVVNFRI